MVAAAGTTAAPRVLDRRRVIIAEGTRQPFHAAEELPFAEAEAMIRKAEDSSRSLAHEALEAALRSLQRQGHEVVACAVLMNSARPLPGLEAVLRSHALIHTAEGALFREALIHAACRHGLQVVCPREKELDAGLLAAIAPLGKHLGPPWTQDQKYAAAGALMALSGS
jgi:hypothetical protein